MVEIVNNLVQELETVLADQKAFKKRDDVKAVFGENRGFNKRVKEVKERLRAAMKDAGETSVVVGNMEVEIKEDVRSKHDMALLAESMDPEKYTEYLSCVQVADDKVVARKANKKRKMDDDET
jgi:hypothetical protein